MAADLDEMDFNTIKNKRRHVRRKNFNSEVDFHRRLITENEICQLIQLKIILFFLIYFTFLFLRSRTFNFTKSELKYLNLN